MFENDDEDTIPSSKPLPEALVVALTPARVSKLFAVGLATDWNIVSFDRGEGWLTPLSSCRFGHRFTIEGPSALYCGPFSPNPWTGIGGLCALGACSYSHSPLPEGMRVGRYCSIGRELKFMDFAHPTSWISSAVAFFRPEGVSSVSALASLVDRAGSQASVNFSRRTFDPTEGRDYPTLGHDVWIGERVTLGMGIRIGTGAVIAAGSIVTRDVPPYAVVAGVPAQVKRLRFDETTVVRLLASRWWRYNFAELNRLDLTEPDAFLHALEALRANDSLPLWQPARITLPDAWLTEDETTC